MTKENKNKPLFNNIAEYHTFMNKRIKTLPDGTREENFGTGIYKVNKPNGEIDVRVDMDELFEGSDEERNDVTINRRLSKCARRDAKYIKKFGEFTRKMFYETFGH